MVDIANTILGKIVDRKQEEFAARLKQRSYKDVEELAQALRICHCITCDRHNAVHQGLALIDRTVDGYHRVHIVHNAAHIRRQHLVVDGASGRRIDELALRSLRILGL